MRTIAVTLAVLATACIPSAAGADSYGGSLDGNGRYVAFVSGRDVYVRDLERGSTRLVSRASGVRGRRGNGTSTAPVIAAAGRFVAFQSTSSNLHPADRDSRADVYVRDLERNTTRLISRGSGEGGRKYITWSGTPSITSNGRYVVFGSFAPFERADGDRLRDVYMRDTRRSLTTLVSRASGARGRKANGTSYMGSITPDGMRVAFTSRGTNLHADDAEGDPDVYMRELTTARTMLVSRADGIAGAPANGTVRQLVQITADDLWVGFTTTATNLDPLDSDVLSDVYVREVESGTTLLASRGAFGKANGPSLLGAVDGEALHVAFASQATNLDPADTDPGLDSYVWDRRSGAAVLVSRRSGATGAKLASPSAPTAITPDARRLAFTVGVTGSRRVYVRDLRTHATILVSR